MAMLARRHNKVINAGLVGLAGPIPSRMFPIPCIDTKGGVKAPLIGTIQPNQRSRTMEKMIEGILALSCWLFVGGLCALCFV